MDSSFSHIVHSIVLVAIAYVILFYVLKQSRDSSMDKSILIGAIALMYMILFGHNFPPRGINPNIY